MLKQMFGNAYRVLFGAMDVPEITVVDLKAALDKKEPLTLIDVRQPSEWEVCHIPGAKLVPMGEIREASAKWDKETHYAVVCHTGGRSARVVQWLRAWGFKNVVNVAGGVEEWADRVDPKMRRY